MLRRCQQSGKLAQGYVLIFFREPSQDGYADAEKAIAGAILARRRPEIAACGVGIPAICKIADVAMNCSCCHA